MIISTPLQTCPPIVNTYYELRQLPADLPLLPRDCHAKDYYRVCLDLPIHSIFKTSFLNPIRISAFVLIPNIADCWTKGQQCRKIPSTKFLQVLSLSRPSFHIACDFCYNSCHCSMCLWSSGVRRLISQRCYSS